MINTVFRFYGTLTEVPFQKVSLLGVSIGVNLQLYFIASIVFDKITVRALLCVKYEGIK